MCAYLVFNSTNFRPMFFKIVDYFSIYRYVSIVLCNK